MRIWKPVLFCLFFFCAFCVCFAPAGQESVLSAAALRSSPSSREEIIHNNWSVSGDTPGLSELACRWVNVKYRGANPGFRAVSVDSRAFPDLLRGFTVTLSDWTVCFQAQPDVLAEEKNAYREQVRMVTVQDR